MNIVVCPEPHAARAGYDTFAAGGNAMDAAIAGAFVQGVTNHLLCGIGGSLTIAWYDAAGGDTRILNAEETIGSRPVPESWAWDVLPGTAEASGRYRLPDRSNDVGYEAIMVPGFVRGCWVAYGRFSSGKLSWEELLAPAVRLAQRGFEVPSYAAAFWRDFVREERKHDAEGGRPRWDVSLGSKELMLRDDGQAYEQGDVFTQADLAETLERIAAHGGDEFYSGDLGAEIGAHLEEQGALVTARDLAGYETVEEEPLWGEFRGLRVAAQPRSNGSQLIELLQILDRLDLDSEEHNSVRYVELVSKAMRAAAADYRAVHGRHEDEVLTMEAEHVTQAKADEWAERIKVGDPIAEPVSPQPARGTTALTAADDAGNVVSINHSIGYGGSGAVVPGLGFLLNGDIGHYNPRPGLSDSVEPGKRFSGGSPLFLFRDERPVLAIGAPGGTRIVTAMVQSVLNATVFGMDMRTAVTAPRFHSQDERRIFLEPTVSEAVASGLLAQGWSVLRSHYQARPQGVIMRNGRLEGGSDPRGQTSADFGQYPPYDVVADPARQE